MAVQVEKDQEFTTSAQLAIILALNLLRQVVKNNSNNLKNLILSECNNKEKMYKVECILDKKVVGKQKKKYYLVKWQGYDVSTSTWQPLSHLSTNCKDIVDSFEKEHSRFKATNIGLVNPPNNPKGPDDQGSSKTPKRKLIAKEKHAPLKSGGFQPFVLQQRKKSISFETPQKFEREREHKKSEPLQYDEKRNHTHSIPDSEPQADHEFELLKNPEPIAIPKSDILGRRQSSERGEAKRDPLPLIPVAIKSKAQSERNRESMRSISAQKPQPVSGSKLKKKRSRREPRVNILEMKTMDGSLTFKVEREDENVWLCHDYMLDNYSRELCLFYEKNLGL